MSAVFSRIAEQRRQARATDYDHWMEIIETVVLNARRCKNFGPVEKHQMVMAAIGAARHGLGAQIRAVECEANQLADREFAGLDG